VVGVGFARIYLLGGGGRGNRFGLG
jgi:hypothetical protein